MKLKALIKRLQALEKKGHGDLQVLLDEGTMPMKIAQDKFDVVELGKGPVVFITIGDEFED